MPISLEICAGAGGQALGLEQAGFDHSALVELDHHACASLRLNRPGWNVIEGNLQSFKGTPFKGIDLLAGGVPCPPFSKDGKQLGADGTRVQLRRAPIPDTFRPSWSPPDKAVPETGLFLKSLFLQTGKWITGYHQQKSNRRKSASEWIRQHSWI